MGPRKQWEGGGGGHLHGALAHDLGAGEPHAVGREDPRVGVHEHLRREAGPL